MADNKQKLRDLFADKTSGDEPVEETVVEEAVDIPMEETPEVPMEEEAPEGEDMDVIQEVKDIYMRWEESEDPISALDLLIGELQELRENQMGGSNQVLPGDAAPLNQPANL